MAGDHIPPEAVAKAAEKGLEFRQTFKRGGTQIGVARARDLKNRANLSPDTIKRMSSYFSRHKVDKRAKNFGDDSDPSPGYIAWLLWGGDAGRDWVEKQKKTPGKGKE
ncbi:hypothetical protein [Rhizobium sp. 9140]|uniref:hypothetical protein n=1 Tax=Rhizobium sp. 9140 TaxID=1761900 RepID=UPI0007949BA5|nr:hypothetical protein [Rhizobium sp. 9140]CZT33065.1 hypothetical protein GA0004734_00000920 [Rhizobium sp. 9140]